jgi:hypothetical protein
MNKVKWGFLVFLVFYLSLAQPGIPACWLMDDPCQVHIHYDKHHAENLHHHDYLFELTTTNPAPALLTMLVPLSLLLAGLFLTLLLHPGPVAVLYAHDPYFSPDSPPPRLFPS